MNRVVTTTLALALIATLALAPAADADNGDCGQPITTGTNPTATDALGVLKAAVGSLLCGICVCDADGSGRTTSTDALRVLKRAVGNTGIALTCDTCDGGGVSGQVLAPNGTVESPEGAGGGENQILPAPGALVELVTINTSGIPVDLLDVTETDEAGQFSFRASQGLGTDHAILVFDSSGEVVLTALATQDPTDVTIATHFVLTSILVPPGRNGDAARGPSAPLDNFTAREYRGCVAQAEQVVVEEIPGTIGELLTALDQATGGALASQVRSFAATPDINDRLNGDYWVFGNGIIHRAEFFPGVIDVSPDTNVRSTAASGLLDSVTFDGAGGYQSAVVLEIDEILRKSSGTQRRSDNSDLKINATVTLTEEDFGSDDPFPGVYDIGGSNSFVGSSDGEFFGGIVSTDGAFLGLLDTFSDETEAGRGMMVGFEKATAADDSLLLGNYHFVGSETFLNLLEDGSTVNRDVGFTTETGTVTGNGLGTLTFQSSGTDIVLRESGQRNDEPPFDPIVDLVEETFGEEPPDVLSYSIASDGRYTVSAPGPVEVASGAITPDGRFGVLQQLVGDGAEAASLFGLIIEESVGFQTASAVGSYVLVGLEAFMLKVTEPGQTNVTADLNLREVASSSVLAMLNLEEGGVATIDALVLDSAGVQDASSVFRTDKNPSGFVSDAVTELLAETEADIDLVGTWSVNATGDVTLDIDGASGGGAIASDGSVLALEIGGNDNFDGELELFRMLLFGFPVE